MSKFIKDKGATILVVIATVILASIAIFTATRLYQLRQESISPAAPESEPAAHRSPGSVGIATHSVNAQNVLTVTHTNNTGNVIQMETTVYNLAAGCTWSEDPSCQAVKWTWSSAQLAPGQSESSSVKLDCAVQIDTYNGTQIDPKNFPNQSYHGEDRIVEHTEWGLGNWCKPGGQTNQCKELSFSLTQSTPAPTITPTGTIVPTSTPTSGPTSTPTTTNVPTSSPTPTTRQVGGPSATITPTRVPTTIAAIITPSEPELPPAGVGMPTLIASAIGGLLILLSLMLAF